MNEPNLILDESRQREQIRADAIAALQAGEDFVIILVKEAEYEIQMMTVLPFDEARTCLQAITNRSRYVRPGSNN